MEPPPPGPRRPPGGIGRDLAVCDACGAKTPFFFRVGNTSPAKRPCPRCERPVPVPGFLGWTPPADAQDPDEAEDDSQANWS